MLEWGDVPNDSTKRQVYYNGVAQPGADYGLPNIMHVNRIISDDPTRAAGFAKEIIADVLSKGVIPSYGMVEVADFLIDKCEDTI